MEEDFLDPAFDGMPGMGYTGRFLDVCEESFYLQNLKATKIADFNDWKEFVSLLLQLKLVDLDDDDPCEDIHRGCTRWWFYATDEHNQITQLSVVNPKYGKYAFVYLSNR